MNRTKDLLRFLLGTALAAFLSLGPSCDRFRDRAPEPGPSADPDTLRSRLVLETRTEGGGGGQISSGTFEVFENRETRQGRTIHLDVVVLYALDPSPRPDPVFPLAGGPGQAAADMWRGYLDSAYRRDRDIVLVSQRGTAGDNLLQVKIGSDDDLQGYLDPAFRTEPFRRELDRLQESHDLTRYSTFAAADDLNEIRIALGYDTINLMGGSYGTRMALVYMKRYPATVRAAVLNGVAPIAFRNPLYHADGAQRALDLVLDQCAADPDCRRAFPDIRDELDAVLERLDQGDADAFVDHPVTGVRTPVKVRRTTFVEALRGMMYSSRRSRYVPLFIHRAYAGDFDPIANEALERSRALAEGLALGMLQCVICAEDIALIDPAEVERETAHTFFGDFRVRGQMAVCEFWPKSVLPGGFADPVSVAVPVLLISGTLDAVTPPRWGEEAAGHLPNGLHIIAPGAHDVGGDCIRGIITAFLDTGSVSGLDTSCVSTMRLPPFVLERPF